MLFLLSNWKLIACGVAGLVLLALVTFAWQTIGGWKADSGQLASCKESLQVQTDAIEKDKELANEYLKNLRGVNAELARVKRLRPVRCICPKADTSRACDGRTSTDNQLHQEDGITTESLYDFAGDAERVRVQLVACQKWAGE